MNKDTVKKRQDLRNRLLIDLYEHYFNAENKSKERYLRLKTENVIADTEIELAYTYLINKGFIKRQNSSSTIALIITTDGIDFVESHLAE